MSFSELGRFAEIHRNAHHSSCSTDMHRVLSYLISTPWMLLSIIQLRSGVLSKDEHSQQSFLPVQHFSQRIRLPSKTQVKGR